ncbi:MAG: M3 family metallopeptidase [Bdellovibrionota bacterium]
MPAIEEGIVTARARLDALQNAAGEVTFENTALALETMSEDLDLAAETYFNLFSAEADLEFQALAKDISPKLAAFSNDISLDPKLFARVKALHDKKDSRNLTGEQLKLVEKQYKGFVRNGALLDEKSKAALRTLDQELSTLGPQFSENLLKATNSFVHPISNEAELEGLSPSVREALEGIAKERGLSERWALSLDMPIYAPFMKFSKNRALREKLWRAYAGRSIGGETDNVTILQRISQLRHDRAKLLGFSTHADYVLAERMAGSPQTVISFLTRILDVAKPRALKDVEDVRELKVRLGDGNDLKPWDFGYYSERLQEEKYSFDEGQVRPFFRLENATEGAFKVAEKLFDLTFTRDESIPVYHPDVKVYRVTDKTTKDFVGLFYTDFFPRPTKKGGAWMTALREQGFMQGQVRRPHVSIVCNFTKPTATAPSLLTFNEVQTLFHEFGHALHGLLSKCTYRSVAGTNVFWDFVELPSQFMENWLLEKDVLDLFAVHYQTGEKMPVALIEKLQAARKFQTACMSLRQVSFGFLDMAWHSRDPSQIKDVFAFEEEVLSPTRVLEKIPGTASSPSFAHIFAGGYSSGYYSYKWAEVLDADAFAYFKEKGLFNQDVARSYRDNILAKGGTEHPMELYKKFRGREPDPDALLKRDGLI